MPAECASARPCSTVLVDPPMAMSSTKALSSACSVTMSSGRMFCSRHRFSACAGLPHQRQPFRVQLGPRLVGVRPRFRRDGAVARQRQPDGFAQAVHRIRREHARATAAAGAGLLRQLLSSAVGHLADAVLAHAFEHGDQVRVARARPASARR